MILVVCLTSPGGILNPITDEKNKHMSVNTLLPPLALLAGLLLTAATASAAPSEGDDKFKNGVPFKELAAEIEANSSDITALQTQMGTLSDGFAQLAVEVDALALQVGANTTAIATARAEIGGLGAGLSAALASLQTMATDLEALQVDVEGNATAIANLEAEMASTAAAVEASILAMNAKLSIMRAELDAEKAALAALHAQVIAQDQALQSQIAGLQAEMAVIQAQADAAATLVAQVVANRDRLALLNSIVAANAAAAATKDELNDLRAVYQSHRHSYQDLYHDTNNAAAYEGSTTSTPTN